MNEFSISRLFLSRLFWKFFASILLAQVAATLAVGGAIWWKNRQNTEVKVELIDTSPRASDAIESASATLQHGGEAALKQFLENMKHHRVYAVNQAQQELLGRAVSASMLEEVRDQLQAHPDSTVVKEIQLAGERYLLFLPQKNLSTIKPLHDLEHLMPRDFDQRPTGPREGFKPHERAQQDDKQSGPPPSLKDAADRRGDERRGPRPPKDLSLAPWILISAAVMVSLLFAAVLAWMFTRPLMALQQAFNAAAQGNLQARFDQRQHWIDDELNQLGQNFDHMTAQLRTMMQQQTKLMHDVSHELRSPLARMQAAIGLIHQQPDRTLTYIDRIERESTRMDHLIGELLTLARLEAGAIQTATETLHIGEIMDALLDDMRFEAEQQAQSLIYHLSDDFRLSAQVDLLVRAIENIVRNTIKYSPAGSQIDIQVGFEHETQMGWIHICDQGPGVPESELESIFQAFYRSQQASHTASGHGLGLAIARQIIHHLQGSIKAMNRPEGGLIIAIHLPAQLLADL